MIHNRFRFTVTILGIAFAIFLMIFQGSLLAGFLRASSKGVEATDCDLWITARGVQCFEFPTPIPSRFREIALGIPGVFKVHRIALGPAIWQRPTGIGQTILMIGAEAGIGSAFPIPYLQATSTATMHESVLVDESNAQLLEVVTVPLEIEINHQRAYTRKVISGFGSFIGSPYVFTTYADSVKYLRLKSEETSYLVIKVQEGSNIKEVQSQLRHKLPEIDVWTKDEFAKQSQNFWVAQTGAGAALMTAAFLGFLVGLMVVSQNIYAITMENLEEFATLKALGATPSYIRRLVLTQALFCGVVGSIIGLTTAVPTIRLARNFIPWAYTPVWLPISMIGVGLVMCAFASTISIRQVLKLDPARVFRA